MLENRKNTSKNAAPIISSLKADAWHGSTGRYAFERWHFDALSDDGREAIVVSFYDNYPFSPRYLERRSRDLTDGTEHRHPAVTFLYSLDGKPALEGVNEWGVDGFLAGTDDVTCSIGSSFFKADKAAYGIGYFVHVDLLTARRRRIEADLEWLSIESDLIHASAAENQSSITWNLVAPRSDVSGRMILTGVRGKVKRVIHFRGTGYHDHFESVDPLPLSVDSRFWGRAHFADSTVVFQHIAFAGEIPDSSLIAVIKNGAIDVHPARFEGPEYHGEGTMTPAAFTSEEGLSLQVRPIEQIQRSVCEYRMLGEVTLITDQAGTRRTTGLIEYCEPPVLSNPFYRWMSDLKIGRNGGSPFF